MWMSSQYFAEASQKLTLPVVTGVVPAVTVAVRVTTVPEATVDTALPLDVMVRVVVVGAAVATAGDGAVARTKTTARAGKIPGKEMRFTVKSPSFLGGLWAVLFRSENLQKKCTPDSKGRKRKTRSVGPPIST